MSPTAFPIEALDRQVRALGSVESPSEVFKLLLEGSRLVVPQAAVFLVRQGRIKGWGSVGYDREVNQAQRAFSVAADHGWFGELVTQPQETVQSPVDPGHLPDFGQTRDAETVALPVCVKGRAIALLVGQRSADQQPWFTEALNLLVHVAQLRLELDLIKRKAESGAVAGASRASAGPAPAAVAATPAAVAAPVDLPVPEPSPVVEPEAPSAAPAATAVATSDDEQKVLEAAKRFARLVATDIRLYNEEAVVQGRHNGDLVDRLGEHLGRGKETFMKRHGELGPEALAILHDAYVQVLAGGEAKLMPSSILE